MKYIKKVLSIVLSIMLLFIPFISYADSAYQDSDELIEYQTSTNENFDNSTNVYAQISENFSVTIPKTIVLSGINKSANYKVSILGDIAGTSLIYIVPDKTFNLNEESGNKNVVIASITQDKLIWSYDEIIGPNNKIANGLIIAQDLTAGKWSGNFNFNILLGAQNEDGSEVDPYNPTIQDVSKINILSTNNKTKLFSGQSNRLVVLYNNIDVTNNVTYTSNSDVITVSQLGVIDASNALPGDEANIEIDYSTPALSRNNFKTNVHVAIEECNHLYDILVDKVEPDCTNPGYEIYKCSICGVEKYNKKITLNTLGHNPLPNVIENNVEPDCVNNGSYDLVSYCSVCNEVVTKEHKIVPALGHKNSNVVVENNINPTCTTKGSYDNVIYCDRCKAEISREKFIVNKTGHTSKAAVKENVVNATCTTAGSYNEVVYCQTCNAKISATPKTINALGHNYVNGKCSRCNVVQAINCLRIRTVDASSTGAAMMIDVGTLDCNNNFIITSSRRQHYGPPSSVNYSGLINIYYPDHGTGWYARALTNIYYGTNFSNIKTPANSGSTFLHWDWSQYYTFYVIAR